MKKYSKYNFVSHVNFPGFVSRNKNEKRERKVKQINETKEKTTNKTKEIAVFCFEVVFLVTRAINKKRKFL